jgi:hypothetical protein
MSMRKRITMLAAFSVPAVSSFVLAAPTDARSSTVHTTASWACYYWQSTVGSQNNLHYYCPIQAGTDFLSGNLSGFYIDTATDNGTDNYVEADKFSYTGTAYSDYLWLPSTQTSLGDYWLAASNVKQNSSAYDYLFLRVDLSGPAGTTSPYSGPYFLGYAATAP